MKRKVSEVRSGHCNTESVMYTGESREANSTETYITNNEIPFKF
jgi:hypothetical protein